MHQDKQHFDTPNLIPAMAEIYSLIHPDAAQYHYPPWQALPPSEQFLGRRDSHYSWTSSSSTSLQLNKSPPTLVSAGCNSDVRKGYEPFSTTTANAVTSRGHMSEFESSAHSNTTVHKRACVSCKARKLKCDKVKPCCSRCSARGFSCTYDEAPKCRRNHRFATWDLYVTS